MRTALSFIVVVSAVSSLMACQQMYTRVVADSKAIAERVTPSTTAPTDSIATRPAVEGSVAAESVKGQVDTTGSTTDRASALTSTANPDVAPLTAKSERTIPTETKTAVEISPSADNTKFAPSNAQLQNSSERTVTSNKPKSESQYLPANVDSPMANETSDAYQRAHSNQVKLRNGDVSIDFSKDMPVINSRIGIDLNSQ